VGFFALYKLLLQFDLEFLCHRQKNFGLARLRRNAVIRYQLATMISNAWLLHNKNCSLHQNQAYRFNHLLESYLLATANTGF